MFWSKRKTTFGSVADELKQHSLKGLTLAPIQEVDYRNIAVASGCESERFIWEVVFLSCAATQSAISSVGLKQQDFISLHTLFLKTLSEALSAQRIRKFIYDEPPETVLLSILTEYSSAFARSSSRKLGISAMCQVFSKRCCGKSDNPILLRQAEGMFTEVTPQIAVFLSTCKFVA